ncbi:hypothetical protein HK098_003845 [Nowakowskiella sp. JEL0407]|nr:hypothetical protein HK098_003845 [Nowakowskiella sp. JEL0407]
MINLSISQTVFLGLASYILYKTSFWVIYALNTTQNQKRLQAAKKDGRVADYMDIPGPVGVPFVGVLPQLIPFIIKKRMDLHWARMNAMVGGICRINAAGQKLVIIDDAAMAKKLLTSPDFGRGHFLKDATEDVIPHALFTLPSGEQWRKIRKGMQPAFGPAHVRESFDISLELVDKLMGVWERQLKKGEVTRNVAKDFTNLTGDVIGKTIFSLDLGATDALETKNKMFEEFDTHMSKLVEVIQARVGLLAMKGIWKHIGIATEQIQPSIDNISSLLQTTFNQKQSLLATKQTLKNGGRDVLERLMTSGTCTDDEILGQMFGFFMAGHETTVNTITWAMLALVENPRVYEKLKAEVDEVLKGEKPTLESLSSLRYLDVFFKETQRHYSAIPIMPRNSLCESTLTSTDGVTIAFPANVQFLINVPRIHKSKEYWGEDAEEFTPERWIVGEDKTLVPMPGSYIPFGDGPMICIGQKMASTQFKVTIIRILQNFELIKSPKQGEITPVLTLTFGLKNGYLVDVGFRKEH